MHYVHNDEVEQVRQLLIESEQSLHYAIPSVLLEAQLPTYSEQLYRFI